MGVLALIAAILCPYLYHRLMVWYMTLSPISETYVDSSNWQIGVGGKWAYCWDKLPPTELANNILDYVKETGKLDIRMAPNLAKKIIELLPSMEFTVYGSTGEYIKTFLFGNTEKILSAWYHVRFIPMSDEEHLSLLMNIPEHKINDVCEQARKLADSLLKYDVDCGQTRKRANSLLKYDVEFYDLLVKTNKEEWARLNNPTEAKQCLS